MAAAPDASRRSELAANLASVRARVAAACADAGRDPAAVHVIAVTKTFPASDVALLHDLGLRDVGENRDQEARVKARELAGLELRWHFVGRLQTNKARSVARYAHVVHSVDRAELVGALSRGAEAAGRELLVLVQVSLDGDARRGGALPVDVADLCRAVAGARALRLGGVMAVAPVGGGGHTAFGLLHEVAEQVRAGHPEATMVSAGMSADLEAAVAHGSTHLRIGTALLGHRPPPVG